MACIYGLLLLLGQLSARTSGTYCVRIYRILYLLSFILQAVIDPIYLLRGPPECYVNHILPWLLTLPKNTNAIASTYIFPHLHAVPPRCRQRAP